MTQDFAKPTTTKKPGATKAKKSSGKAKQSKAKAGSPKVEPASSGSGKRFPFYLSLALLLGAFAYGLYFLKGIPPTQTPEPKSSITPIKKQDRAVSQPTNSEERRFNFYEILPETTVKPPKVEEYRFKERAAANSYAYIVQTGSFKNRSDAERQKATIAFQGLKADIKTVTNSKGTVWHRVQTGPFYDRSKLNSALDKLVSINIEPLVKKTKKDS